MAEERVAAVIRAGGAWAQPVVGKTVLERVVEAALEAGADPCVVLSIEPPPARVRDLPGVRWTREEAEARGWVGREFLLIETDALYDARLIQWVMDARPEPGRARAVRMDGHPVLSKVHIGAKAGGPEPSLLEAVPKGWLFPVRTHQERNSAQQWLFNGLADPGETFLTGLLERPPAGLLTWLLWPLPLAGPVLAFLGMAAGLFAASSLTLAQPIRGALLLALHLVLDRAGRDLARLKLESRRFVGLATHWPGPTAKTAVLLGAAMNVNAAGGLAVENAAFALGGAAALALPAIAALTYGAPRDPERLEGPYAKRYARLASISRRNDLILLAIVATLAGKLAWLLLAAGVLLPGLAVAIGLARSNARLEPGGALL